MGIYYRAAIFVGLPRNVVSDVEGFEEMMYHEALLVGPPHYDGGDADYAIVGYEAFGSGAYCAAELEYDVNAIDDLKAKFKDITGMDARVYISPYGY